MWNRGFFGVELRGCVELRVFGVELRAFWSGTEGFLGLERTCPFVLN